MQKPIGPIYLERDFRNILFCRAYENSGRSLAGIGSEIGYSAKGRNGLIRDMWLGTLGIPSAKISGISRLAGVPLEEVLSHMVSKNKNLEIKSWMEAFEQFQSPNKKEPKNNTV